MGCFLSCFGSSRDGSSNKRPKQGKRRVGVGVHVQNPDQTSFASQSAKLITLPQQDVPIETPTNLAPRISEKHEEKSSGSSQRKVRFDGNIKAYEHVPSEEDSDDVVEECDVPKADLSESSKEESSVTTSVSSYPPNHRYENCRDSDDEYSYWVDSGESDLDDEDGDSNDLSDDDDDCDGDSDGDITNDSTDEIDETNGSPIPTGHKSSLVTEKSSGPLKQNVLDRNAYIPPVLRPVENLSQWKAVKARGNRVPSSKHLKENLASDLETMISSNNDKAFREAPFCVEEKVSESKKSTLEVRVDASLSSWLTSSENMPTGVKSRAGFDDAVSGRSTSLGSSSLRYLEDRRILGALTVGELREDSPKSSPRKSPSQSPDEMPLIGTVGTYWSDRKPEHNSSSASSLKGIPNITSEYRQEGEVAFDAIRDKAGEGSG